MRGIDVDKGLNTLENGCAERGAFLRRYMVRLEERSLVFLLKRESIVELKAGWRWEVISPSQTLASIINRRARTLITFSVVKIHPPTPVDQ